MCIRDRHSTIASYILHAFNRSDQLCNLPGPKEEITDSFLLQGANFIFGHSIRYETQVASRIPCAEEETFVDSPIIMGDFASFGTRSQVHHCQVHGMQWQGSCKNHCFLYRLLSVDKVASDEIPADTYSCFIQPSGNPVSYTHLR